MCIVEQAMKILNNPDRAETAAAAESLMVSDDSQDSVYISVYSYLYNEQRREIDILKM